MLIYLAQQIGADTVGAIIVGIACMVIVAVGVVVFIWLYENFFRSK